jgi:HlyD family secretion protein
MTVAQTRDAGGDAAVAEVPPPPVAAAVPRSDGRATAGGGDGGARVIALPTRRRAILQEFQPDALEVEHRAPPAVTRLTLYVVAALIVSAIAWAALSHVDRVVVAQGKLVTTAPNLVVQPLETSVVRSLPVAVGDVVRAGEVVATLDPTFSESDVRQLREKLASRAAQVARLEAEIEGRPYQPTAQATPGERLQAESFAQRQAYVRAKLSDFDARRARTLASVETNKRDQEVLQKRLEAARELETMRMELLQKQIGSRVSLLETRNARLELEGRIEHLRQNLPELSHELDAITAERQTFREQFRQETLDELVKLRGERDATAEELNKATLRQRMVALTAPADAVVLEVAARSVGSVVREAEPLLTLVPLNAPLEAELAVEARDVGRIAVGQTVRVKLDAFPYQEHGMATGRLRVISEGAFAKDRERQSAAAEPVYRARVTLDDVSLRNVPQDMRLLPGMTVAGEVVVGQRNVLSYFLHPLLRGLDESLREP